MISTSFYGLYNTTTFELSSVSGHMFDTVPNGCSVCQLSDTDGTAINSGKKIMHDYLVKVNSDGLAILRLKNPHIVIQRKPILPNVVADLNYKILFFDRLNINYIFDHSSIKLTVTSLDDWEYFKEEIEFNSKCLICVTDFQQPDHLIKTFEIDLIELKTKPVTIQFEHNKEISVWGIR